jgi:hypothetical protein
MPMMPPMMAGGEEFHHSAFEGDSHMEDLSEGYHPYGGEPNEEEAL